MDLSNKQLKKSNNRVVAGVCGGIAEYFGLDYTLVRAAYAILTIFSAAFPGCIIYLILMFVMPSDNR